MASSLFHNLLPQVQAGSFKALARCISLVENQVAGYELFMQQLPSSRVPIIGITGPPGAGKSTLVDGLVNEWVSKGKKVGIICVDPSSPFNLGALLGDRIRMSTWYNHPGVFIRSLATRGSVGGLNPGILEITDVMRLAAFDYVLVETVGVGQSEIEIAGLSDVTVVVLVPEAGDEIQAMKAGLMEIANVFVVNKADRPNADEFIRNLRLVLSAGTSQAAPSIPILKTTALQKEGLSSLVQIIEEQLSKTLSSDKKYWLLAERAYHLIQKERMSGVSKLLMKEKIISQLENGTFNMYRLVQEFG
ncbi:MAG: methylmalonyl Co-A mutase-associated GTPase MeaB [Bacteroidota bacterium]